jgi:hypothetical protein
LTPPFWFNSNSSSCLRTKQLANFSSKDNAVANPVRIQGLGLGKAEQRRAKVQGCEDPRTALLARRLQALADYPWSSWRVYSGAEPKPVWLRTEVVGSGCGGRGRKGQQEALREYTQAPVRQGRLESPWERLVGGCVLGDLAYARKCLQRAGANENVVATVAFYYPSTVTGDAEASLALNYYDGAEWISVLSSGGVAPTKDTTDNLDGTVSGGRFTVTFDTTSTPSILDLGGTVFVMFDTAPQVGTITGPVGPVALANPITLTATYGAFGAAEVSLLNFIWGDGTETPVIPGMEGLACISLSDGPQAAR